MTDKERIIQALDRYGIVPRDDEWRETEDGIQAVLGRWSVIADDEERGLFAGDEGELTAIVVGAEQYNNQRVSIAFSTDYDDAGGGPEVVPFDDVEPIV